MNYIAGLLKMLKKINYNQFKFSNNEFSQILFNCFRDYCLQY
jgi:hypothetical protein